MVVYRLPQCSGIRDVVSRRTRPGRSIRCQASRRSQYFGEQPTEYRHGFAARAAAAVGVVAVCIVEGPRRYVATQVVLDAVWISRAHGYGIKVCASEQPLLDGPALNSCCSTNSSVLGTCRGCQFPSFNVSKRFKNSPVPPDSIP